MKENEVAKVALLSLHIFEKHFYIANKNFPKKTKKIPRHQLFIKIQKFLHASPARE